MFYISRQLADSVCWQLQRIPMAWLRLRNLIASGCIFTNYFINEAFPVNVPRRASNSHGSNVGNIQESKLSV